MGSPDGALATAKKIAGPFTIDALLLLGVEQVVSRVETPPTVTAAVLVLVGIGVTIWAYQRTQGSAARWRVAFTVALGVAYVCVARLLVTRLFAVPAPPQIQIKTLRGIRPPFTDEDVRQLREYEFTIENKGRRPLHQVLMHVQFPEFVVSLPPPPRDWLTSAPDGVRIEPILSDPPSFVDRGGAPVHLRIEPHEGQPTPVFRIAIGDLNPHALIAFYFRSKPGPLLVWQDPRDGSWQTVRPVICGQYQFERQSEWVQQLFKMPLTFNSATRAVNVEAPRTDIAGCPPIAAPGGVKISLGDRADGGPEHSDGATGQEGSR